MIPVNEKHDNNTLEIIISEKEALAIRDGLKDIRYSPTGNNDYMVAIRMAAYRALPKRIITALHKQKTLNNLSSHIVFNNVPVDDVYGSPTFNQSGIEFKSGNLSENIICAFAAIISEPYSISFEGRELVNNLTPQPDTKYDYTGLGSEVELDFHTENAALRFMAEDDYSPEGMFLLGIRKDPSLAGPKTYVSDARKALDLLTSDDIETLRGNNFIIRVPHRWRNAFANNENTDLCSIISGPSHLPRVSIAFYSDMVLPVNNRAKKAVASLYEAIKSVSVGIEITPGKLVYIDNRFTLHSREKFSPTYDENGCAYRWLQRIFIAPSMWRFRPFYAVGERVFDPAKIAV